jgi:hypothetical protein
MPYAPPPRVRQSRLFLPSPVVLLRNFPQTLLLRGHAMDPARGSVAGPGTGGFVSFCVAARLAQGLPNQGELHRTVLQTPAHDGTTQPTGRLPWRRRVVLRFEYGSGYGYGSLDVDLDMDLDMDLDTVYDV